MHLTEEPEIVNWPETHYVFVERIGPFLKNAPQAWQDLHTFVPELAVHNRITGAMSLYKIGPMIYRAGFSLAVPPVELPEGLFYEKFNGGKYCRFVLTGAYSNLPQACSRVFEIVAERHIPVRDDFYIEHCANDPRMTAEEQLITEILVPTAE